MKKSIPNDYSKITTLTDGSNKELELKTITNTKNDKDDYVYFAKKTLKSYYKHKDLGNGFEAKESVSLGLDTFLSEKAYIKQYSTELNNNYITNYDIDIKLIENKTFEDKTYLKFQVATSFNYIDLPDIDSGEGTVVEVLIDNESSKIIDIYDSNNYFDNSTRGVDLDILDDSNRIKPSQIDSIKVKSKNFKKTISNEYTEKNDTVSKPESSAKSSITTSATRYSLNGSSISTYARNNYSKKSPSSGNGTVPYYDFAQISGNWDCTNFVSHALLAGGATVNDTGTSGISNTGWYYRSTSNRSSSWTGVNNLYNFMSSNTTKGPSGTAEVYSTRKGSSKSGDIIQFHNGSTWAHSTIVTGTYAMDDREGALVTGRTSYGAYNDNQKASDIYPGYSKRVITPYNYK